MTKTKKKMGGARPGAGRPANPQLVEMRKALSYIRQHANTVVALKDKETGKLVKKKRLEFLLDVLFQLGVNQKNVPAIKEYFNRSIGKAIQYIDDITEDKPLTDKKAKEIKEKLKELL